jgi:hypothetical protein
MENPNTATAVIATLTAVTFPAPNLCKSLSLKRLDMIVPAQVSIDIVPTKDTGALISVCTTGHIDPKSESGKPKLIKQIYMSVNNRLPILK